MHTAPYAVFVFKYSNYSDPFAESLLSSVTSAQEGNYNEPFRISFFAVRLHLMSQKMSCQPSGRANRHLRAILYCLRSQSCAALLGGTMYQRRAGLRRCFFQRVQSQMYLLPKLFHCTYRSWLSGYDRAAVRVIPLTPGSGCCQHQSGNRHPLYSTNSRVSDSCTTEWLTPPYRVQ